MCLPIGAEIKIQPIVPCIIAEKNPPNQLLNAAPSGHGGIKLSTKQKALPLADKQTARPLERKRNLPLVKQYNRNCDIQNRVCIINIYIGLVLAACNFVYSGIIKL